MDPTRHPGPRPLPNGQPGPVGIDPGVVPDGLLLLPLVGGSFDLSVGATAVLADIVAGAAMSHHHAPTGVAILLAIAFGATIGLVNGLGVAYLVRPAGRVARNASSGWSLPSKS